MKFFKRLPISPEEKAILRKDRILLILSGLVTGLSFPPVPFPYALFVSLVPLLMVIQRRSGFGAINRAMFLFALSFSSVGIYWVSAPTMIRDQYLLYGGIASVVLNAIAMLIFSVFYSVGQLAFGKTKALVLFPFFWLAYEYIYLITDWSFPWLHLGNGLSSSPVIIQSAEIFGAEGLSFFILVANIGVYLFIVSTETTVKRIGAALFVSMVLFPLLYGMVRINTYTGTSSGHLRVGVIQPNIDPYDKWLISQPEKLVGLYKSMGREQVKNGAEILMWPETAVPVYIASPVYSEILNEIRKYVNEDTLTLLTGVPDIRYYNSKQEGPPDVKQAGKDGYYYATYNAAYLFRPEELEIQKYGKIKLVPFGERTPFVDQIPLLGELLRWGVGLGGWNVGQDTLPLISVHNGDTLRTGAMICYESVYPEISATLSKKGAQYLALITNDSWYGNTSGPYQHRDYARLRAVENRRAFVRCANGGISCLILPTGVIEQQTSMYTQAAALYSVPLNNEITFYSKHPFLLYKIAFSISIAALLYALLKKRKRKIKGVV